MIWVFVIFLIIALIPIHLAYLEEYMENSKKKKPIEKKKKPSLQVKKGEDNIVFNECVQALVGLGMKKMDAKIKTRLMFSNKNYNQVEQFLMEVYKNE